MQTSGYEPRPSVLEKEFNTRYWGRPITYQAVTRWLKGEAVPRQDKLQVLAEWLGVEPQYLRFGETVVRQVRERKARREEGFSAEERQLLDAYLQLPMDKRKLLCEVMQTFVLAYGEKTRAYSSGSERINQHKAGYPFEVDNVPGHQGKVFDQGAGRDDGVRQFDGQTGADLDDALHDRRGQGYFVELIQQEARVRPAFCGMPAPSKHLDTGHHRNFGRRTHRLLDTQQRTPRKCIVEKIDQHIGVKNAAHQSRSLHSSRIALTSASTSSMLILRGHDPRAAAMAASS